MAFALPKAAAGTMATGAMLGTGALVGMGMGLGTIMAIGFFCRACRTRGRVPRDQWDGKCTNCGEGIYKRDIKRTTMPAPAQQQNREVSVLESENPVDVLKMRLAKGEISPIDYQTRMKLIQGT